MHPAERMVTSVSITLTSRTLILCLRLRRWLKGSNHKSKRFNYLFIFSLSSFPLVSVSHVGWSVLQKWLDEDIDKSINWEIYKNS